MVLVGFRCLDRDPARRPSFIEIMQNLINIRAWLDSQNLLYEHPPNITMDELVRHSSLTEDKGLGCGVGTYIDNMFNNSDGLLIRVLLG